MVCSCPAQVRFSGFTSTDRHRTETDVITKRKQLSRTFPLSRGGVMSLRSWCSQNLVDFDVEIVRRESQLGLSSKVRSSEARVIMRTSFMSHHTRRYGCLEVLSLQ